MILKKQQEKNFQKIIARCISKRDSQKEKKPYKIKWLYECFGITKQAYYKRIRKNKQKEEEAETIKKIIEPIRKKMPRYGTKKLHLDIKDDLKGLGIKIGRDAFIKFARNHRLLVREQSDALSRQIQNTCFTNRLI